MGSDMYLAKFREKVKGVLEKVENLKEKLKQVSSEKVLVQSEICGQFILLDWVFKWEEDKGNLKEEQSEAFEELKKEVKLARLGASATPADLDKLPILEVGKKGAGEKKPEGNSQEETYFPSYFKLPGPVVREHILNYLTSPDDKLNLIKAIPSEGQLMGWEENSLKLQSVCQILMKGGYLQMKDLYSISKVTEELRESVKEHYEQSLVVDVDLSKQWRILLETEELTENFPSDFTDEVGINDENYLLNPFTVEIRLDLDKGDDHHGSPSAEQMTLLERFGHKIWNFYLKLKYKFEMNIPENMAIISSCLHLMPNLRRLQVGAGYPYSERPHRDLHYLQKQWSLIEKIPLPDLPHLKALELLGRCQGFEVVNRKVLDKYAKQLHLLGDQHEYPMLDSYLEESYKLICPSLSILKLRSVINDEEEESHCLECNMGYLRMFQDSPLKTVVLYLPNMSARARLPDLLTLLSRQFGGTLENLSLYLCNISEFVELRDTPPPTTPSTWFFDLNFPNLKTFSIDDLVQGDGLGYLLRFPALETLKFDYVDGLMEELFEKEPYLTLSAESVEMLTSNVWKLFPSLNLYSLNNGDGGNNEMLEIKRKDCLWSQEHGNRIPPYFVRHPDEDQELKEEEETETA